ncbi:MAG: VWA domain-containing protein [Acidobacteria bacterium]|nr:VWA domain-containing protein [Acidobacteriota bacterium]
MIIFKHSVIPLLALVLIAGASALLSAQQSSPERQTKQDIVRINTQLVQVDVVVTDRKGKHVEDLNAADFELLVDGQRQPLTHFSHINLPVIKRSPSTKKKSDSSIAPEAMPTRQIAAEEVRRTVAFIVDDLGLSPSSMELVRETLRRFVNEQMQEGDLIAIIRTGSGLGMLEQYTSDKRILYAAIERLIWNPLSRDMMPGFAEAGSEDEADDAAAEKQAAIDAFEEFRETSFTTGTLGAIRFVVGGLRSLPGRKSVIFLSDGFRINSRNDNDNNSEQVLQNLRNLVEVANRSSVVVYSIDAKGLQSFMPGAGVGGRPSASSYSDALQSSQEALEGPGFLARQTGGFTIVNTNDLNIGVEEALYDQQSYYLIGFDPEDEKFDQRYHSIKVNVTRPGVKVRTRSGFFGVDESVREKEEEERPRTRGQQILSALLAPPGINGLSLRMTPYFFNSSKEGPLVRALFHIDCSRLKFKDGPNGQKLINLDLAAFAFNEEGAAVDLAMRRLELSFDEKQYRQALTGGLSYRADFQLKKAGAYQFRAVLREGETGITGSASQFIRVPDLSNNRLALSGLILTSPREGEKGSQTVDPEATPYLRRFPRTGWIQYGAAIYNSTVDKKTGLPQITVQATIYRDGKPAYQFPGRQLEFSAGADAKRFDYVGRLRMNDFPPGEYLLRLVVTDGLAKKKFGRAEQWMDFSVK